jgi:LAS superfamily LD-carboxypeptidase LdcB
VTIVAGVVALATAGQPGAVAAATAHPTGVTALATVAVPTLARIAGADRFATSVAASRAAFPTGTPVPVVYLAPTVFDEAYSAVPVAAAQGGAVLLTRPDVLPSVVAAELDRLNPGRIVLIGDTSRMSSAVASAAARYGSVSRIGVSSRAGTSLALNRSAFTTAGRVWVATGSSTSESVLAAVAAAGQRSPLMVVQGTAAGLTAAQSALVRDLGVTAVTIVGGTGAVSPGIASDLAALVGAANVVRASAVDRPATSARVNALAWPSLSPGTAYLASAADLGSAFAGALLAGRTQRPLYYTAAYCASAPVRPTLAGPAVTRVALLGPESSLRLLAGRLEACRSIDAASSVWVLVNKRNAVSPRTYAPGDLVVPSMPYADGHRMRSEAAIALSKMAGKSYAEGAGRIGIDTAYRSFATQKALYDKYLALKGRTWTDTWYMRPGYSEHQTGLAVDLLPIGRSNCRINDCIDETPQGVWLAKNAWRFGFVLRYEKGRTSTTGMGFEPWHFRFVGGPLARAYRDGQWHTYEQYLGEPAAPTY